MKRKWPDADPIDKSDPNWEFNNNANINGVSYKREEVSPEKWQWVVDEVAVKLLADSEKRRRELFWALRSRVLTDDEMNEVASYGNRLNIDNWTPYMPEEKSRELNDALFQQFKMQIAMKASKDQS